MFSQFYLRHLSRSAKLPYVKYVFRILYTLHAKCYYSDTYIVLKLLARYSELRGDKHVSLNCRIL